MPGANFTAYDYLLRRVAPWNNFLSFTAQKKQHWPRGKFVEVFAFSGSYTCLSFPPTSCLSQVGGDEKYLPRADLAAPAQGTHDELGKHDPAGCRERRPEGPAGHIQERRKGTMAGPAALPKTKREQENDDARGPNDDGQPETPASGGGQPGRGEKMSESQPAQRQQLTPSANGRCSALRTRRSRELRCGSVWGPGW